jgi:hypothetical protein
MEPERRVETLFVENNPGRAESTREHAFHGHASKVTAVRLDPLQKTSV